MVKVKKEDLRIDIRICTPRFLEVRIIAIFKKSDDAWQLGFTESTDYEGDFRVWGAAGCRPKPSSGGRWKPRCNLPSLFEKLKETAIHKPLFDNFREDIDKLVDVVRRNNLAKS